MRHIHSLQIVETVLIKQKKQRAQPTIDFKLRVLEEIETGKSQIAVAKAFNISQSQISKWLAKLGELQEAKKAGKKSRRRMNDTSQSRAWFPEQEVLTFEDFIERREVRGLKTTGIWVRLRMLNHVEETKPVDWWKFTASTGWLCKWQKRFHIADLARTNKKIRPISQRIDKIRAWHQWMAKLRESRQNHEIYGRFAPDAIFSMDQVPLPFALNSSRSLNRKGQQCYIAICNAKEKRQATLNIWIRAEGQQLRPEIIFRGKGGLDRRHSEELAYYRNVQDEANIMFQPKAWADQEVMLQSLECFIQQTREIRQKYGEILLILDQHGSQATAFFRIRAAQCGIILAYTPSSCTDVVAPVDHHIGANLKQMMSGFYHEELRLNYDQWVDEGISAGECRMLMLEWLLLSWKAMCAHPDMIRQAFVSTGCMLAVDGSDWQKVKIHTLPNYDYRQMQNLADESGSSDSI